MLEREDCHRHRFWVRQTTRSELYKDKLVREYVQPAVLVGLNESTMNVARLMAANDSCSAVVTLNDKPVGIVTEWDILTRLVVLGKDASQTPVKEVMSAPLWIVNSSIKVYEAIRLMLEKGLRRLVVRQGNKSVGIVSSNVIMGNRRENSIPVSLLESPNSHGCPFCGKVMKSKEEISEHIDGELGLTESAMRNS